ncbi:MAG: hypothetical protein ACJ71T_01460 [Actinomycetales bacterium]
MGHRLTVLLTASVVAASGLAVTATPAFSAAPAAARTAALAASTAGEFTPVGPNRILDTRIGQGLVSKIGAGSTRTLQVTGAGGVPGGGQAAAVVFNLTVTNPSASSYVTVWPTGASRPTASNINFRAGWTGANLVTVGLGTNGQVNFYNKAGSVDVIGDVVGWYSSASATGTGNFQVLGTPTRLWDSRPSSTIPGNHVPMAGGDKLTIPIDVSQGTTSANAHVKAVVVSLTAVNPDSGGHLTAWSGSGSPPTASVLNYSAGSVVPNLAVVPTTLCCGGFPSFTILNSSNGHTNILVDLWGFYDDGGLSGGLKFKSLSAPIRIVDTRTGLGGASTLGTGSTRHILAPGSVAGAPTQLLVQNVTSIPSANTYLTFWPAGQSRPTVSNLNPRANHVVAGLAYTGVGASNDFSFYNYSGADDVVVDVAGSMEADSGAGPAGAGAVAVAPVAH